MSKTIQIVEIRQKRCANRFGAAPCTATGTPKCFQTYQTCKDRANFNLDGQMSWYFHRHGDPVPALVDATDPNIVKPLSIPKLRSVSTKPTRINVAGLNENSSPFGLLGEVSVSLDDFIFENQFGDFYSAERSVKASFSRLLLAWIGDAVQQLELYLYTGFEGATSLADMTQRRYDVSTIQPSSNGVWSITGIDPLGRATRKKAQFPPATDLRLQSDLDELTTSILVSGTEFDVSKPMGNDGFFYGRLGDEIIKYTGYTAVDSLWQLDGVERGALATVKKTHKADDSMKRVAHYENIPYWQLAYDILINHTTVTADLIPYDPDWIVEGETWLGEIYGTGTYTSSRPATTVLGEAMRDGLFFIHWDERDQLIKMQAVRQPTAVTTTLTERNSIVSSSITLKPDDRRTRLTTYYEQRDPTESLTSEKNYAKQLITVDGEAEGEFFADGTVRNLVWYSPLMRADLNATLVHTSFLRKYRITPQYLSLTLAAKDENIKVGTVIYVESYEILDSLGNPTTSPWQVIEWEEVEPGFTYKILCQSFALIENPGFIMENDAVDFDDPAAEAEPYKLWLCDDDGLLPDGSPGYLLH